MIEERHIDALLDALTVTDGDTLKVVEVSEVEGEVWVDEVPIDVMRSRDEDLADAVEMLIRLKRDVNG